MDLKKCQLFNETQNVIKILAEEKATLTTTILNKIMTADCYPLTAESFFQEISQPQLLTLEQFHIGAV